MSFCPVKGGGYASRRYLPIMCLFLWVFKRLLALKVLAQNSQSIPLPHISIAAIHQPELLVFQ
jgi:hypothetical protein